MEFHELQAAIEWGYSVSEWQRESPVNRARAMAHVIHKNLREAYQAEEAMEKSDGHGRQGQGVNYADAMNAMLGLK